MIIPINENWRLRSDKRNYIVEQRFTPGEDAKKKEPYWLAEGYYQTIESACMGCYELRLRLSKAEGLGEAMAEAKRLSKELSNALQPYIRLEAA